MYGLILEGIATAVREKYGEEAWQAVRQLADVSAVTFRSHKRYSETLVPRLIAAAHKHTGDSCNDLMHTCGHSFVGYIENYGYHRIMSVLGRQLRDFLNGLDNLHEYLRFTYPRMKPPSFFCADECSTGLTLHYRSKRKGYVHYVIGQIQSVAMRYYKTPVTVEVLRLEEVIDLTHVVMRLTFDNSVFAAVSSSSSSAILSTAAADNLAIRSDIFFEVFPFHILFNRSMVIKNVGTGLATVMPKLLGRAVDEMFTVVRPAVEFTIQNLTLYINNIFEFESVDSVRKLQAHHVNESDTMDMSDDDDERTQRFRLKGQILLMETSDVVIFLATPIIETISSMFDAGLYINDLSMHDSSRDLVLAGTQQSAELKLALDQEQKKSKVLEESMQQLDVEMRRTDSLLYQMIPRSVADRLRKGEPAVDTCEVFEQVTILFSDVVGFTSICSQITPMAVVSMLNNMYTTFDTLSEKNKVYKVETIGDAYMVVSGAPMVTIYHALYVSDMALDMLDAMTDLIEPSSGKHMRIRVGLHSGTVVAGVVGMKMPRYCLFGNTVNTASQMECNGEAMKINISETTKCHLDAYGYPVVEHGTIEVTGNKTLRTFWLTGRSTSDNKFHGMTATNETAEESVDNSPASSVENLDHIDDRATLRNGDPGRSITK